MIRPGTQNQLLISEYALNLAAKVLEIRKKYFQRVFNQYYITEICRGFKNNMYLLNLESFFKVIGVKLSTMVYFQKWRNNEKIDNYVFCKLGFIEQNNVT